jgi:signal transduction histidine kinase
VEEHFFRLALDETLTNAVKHGNASTELSAGGGDAAKEITLTVRFTKRGVKVTVCDEGRGFCVEQVSDPRSVERRFCRGGRGVWMLRLSSAQVLNTVGEVECRGACVEVRL